MSKTKAKTKKVKFSKETELPALYQDVEVNEKEADRILQHGFGSLIMDIRCSTPQKGDILNFRVVEDGICSLAAPWNKLNDLAGTVLNVQAGKLGIEKGYAVVTFVIGDTIKVDADVNADVNNTEEG